MQNAWLNCSKVGQATFQAKDYSNEIQLLKRMNICNNQ